MFFRTIIAATALVSAVPAAAIDVIASFTPVNDSSGSFLPVRALLTGLVEGVNLGANIGLTVIDSPVAGTLGTGYTPQRSSNLGGPEALTVTNGLVTQADFYWTRGPNIYFSISTIDLSTPQIVNFGSPFGYAEAPGGYTTFTTAPAAAVPEPESWLMLIAGFGLVGAMQRRRKLRMA